jgi:hypothetical protein
MRKLLLFLAAALTAAPISAQEPVVVWSNKPGVAGAIALTNLLESYNAYQNQIRTTPMVHRKTGLWPQRGTVVAVRPGEMVVSRLTYRASYLARPGVDFKDTRGYPVRAETMRAVRMLNNSFCVPAGTRCFKDQDADGDWDDASRDERGRQVDIPYSIIELREEVQDGSRFDLVLVSSGETGLSLENRELFNGKLAASENCSAPTEGAIRCGPFSLSYQGVDEEGRVKLAIE